MRQNLMSGPRRQNLPGGDIIGCPWNSRRAGGFPEEVDQSYEKEYAEIFHEMIEEADTGLDKLRPTFLAARGTNGMEVTMVGPSIAENIEFFRLIVDQAPDAIIVADRQGQIQIWNHTAADLFGFRPDEAIGRSLDIIIPEHLTRLSDPYATAAILWSRVSMTS